MNESIRRRIWSGEAREFRDAQTGARIVQLTNHPSINHNLFFLTSSFTSDLSGVVFASYRTGSCQFFMTGFPEGPIIQVTDQPHVHGHSAAIAHHGGGMYYCANGGVWFTDFILRAHALLFASEGGSLGEVSLSPDGTRLVTAMKRDDRSHLVLVNTDGSGGRIILAGDRTIIHPQFHPTDATVILYAQDPAPRMWMINADGSNNRCLFEHDNDCFLVHESFLGRGDELIVVQWNHALCRFDWRRGSLHRIVAMSAWHLAGNRAGTQVLCDTNHPDLGIRLVDVATGEHRPVCYPQSSNQGSQWKTNRYALAEDFARAAQNVAETACAAEHERALSWMEMKVDTVYGPQWTHPHPSFSPDERWVCYTSDVTGNPQVYAAEIGTADSGNGLSGLR